MDSTLTSTRDILIFGLPLIVMLLASMFKVDELFGASKHRTQRRTAQRLGTLRRSMMSDPDGRPWSA